MTNDNEHNNNTDNTAKQQRGRPFKKGESGNPAGRPKGSRNKTTLAIQELLDGEADIITRKAIELAKEGDMTAIKLVIDRIVPTRKDAPVTFELGDITTMQGLVAAMDELMQSVGNGELTPLEAQKILPILEKQRNMIASAMNPYNILL